MQTEPRGQGLMARPVGVDLLGPDPVPADAAPADADQDQQDWTPPTWEEIVRDHSARVYRLAYRLTGNAHDAEDLTQDVFVRVFRSLHRFQPGTFEGWLHRITTNLFLDSARRKQKIRFDGLADNSAERLASPLRTPGEVLDDADLDHDVAAALDALLPEFRAAVVLCDIEGLSYEEIASALDIKIGTVRSRIHRGRAQLREALAHRRPTGERERYLGAPDEDGRPVAAVPSPQRRSTIVDRARSLVTPRRGSRPMPRPT